MPSDTKPNATAPSDRTQCLLLIDPPSDGAWNMAVDEALLTEVATTGMPVLRFYQWAHPTLSLGYFQKALDRALHSASASADMVRRLSGGGAILHDRELTYSLILPATHELARDTQRLYDVVHQSIVSVLNELLQKTATDWEPTLCSPPPMTKEHVDTFLCFQRRAEGDILLRKNEASTRNETHKIVGSAQRRRKGTVLQHGSLLFAQSKAAPELLGIAELTGLEIAPDDLQERLPKQFANSLSLDLLDFGPSPQLVSRIEQLRTEKYTSENWTARR